MRILVVEDESTISDAIKRGLEAEGYAVDVADRGDEGLWMAQENRYDGMILDLMLPGMNGFVVCTKLRESGDQTPILMLTAKDGSYDEAEGLDSGADDYLTKPFEWVVLLARLRVLLRRSGTGQASPELSVDDLTLNPLTRKVLRGETEIELTPREFSLLRYLMHRKDQVVTKDELLDHVWGEGELGDPNVIQVYVGYLRKKVDTPFSVESIETVRGVGYRIVGGLRR